MKRMIEMLDIPMRKIVDAIGDDIIDIYKDSNVKYRPGNCYIAIPGGSFHMYEVDILEIPVQYYNDFLYLFRKEKQYKDTDIVNPFEVIDITDYDYMVATNSAEFKKMKDIIVYQSIHAFQHSQKY